MVDLNALIANWFNLVFDYVTSLGNYQIVEGVTFFGVLIAIGIFSIIVRFFFSKIISEG